jgi:HEAT repeat protein
MSGRDNLRRVRAAFALWQIERKADDVVPVLVAALLEKLTPVGIATQPSNAPPTGRYVASQAATALGEIGAAAASGLPQLRDAKANGDLVLSTAAAAAIKKIEGAK